MHTTGVLGGLHDTTSLGPSMIETKGVYYRRSLFFQRRAGQHQSKSLGRFLQDSRD